MANYKLGPVIGKIGGAEVQKIPISLDGYTPSDNPIFHTLTVPDGETWLVAVSVDAQPHSLSGNHLEVGGVRSVEIASRGPMGMVIEATGQVDIRWFDGRNINSNTTVDGHVYTAPLP